MEKWQDKTTVKKGNFAEDIVHKFLEDKGFIVYIPQTKGAHPFDRLAIKNKEKVIIVDVKAKARLTKLFIFSAEPEYATGLNKKHYQEYKNISKKHNIPVWIFFADEIIEKIYGNTLDNLDKFSKEMPWGKGIVIFPISKMNHVCNLNKDQVLYLKQCSTRNYEYK